MTMAGAWQEHGFNLPLTKKSKQLRNSHDTKRKPGLPLTHARVQCPFDLKRVLHGVSWSVWVGMVKDFVAHHRRLSLIPS